MDNPQNAPKRSKFRAALSSLGLFFSNTWNKVRPLPGKFLARVTEFFQWSGGTNLAILREQPRSVRSSRAQFGRMMFLANLASGILLAHVATQIYHDSMTGICVGIFWFFLVWMFDRYYVFYIDRYGKDPNAKSVIRARKAMVYTFGFINAVFVMFFLFHTEINEEIQKRTQAQKKEVADTANIAISTLKGELADLDERLSKKATAYTQWAAMQENEITQKRNQLKARRDSLIGEIVGLVGTGIKGYGPAAQANEAAIHADSLMLVEMQTRFDSAKYLSPAYLEWQEEQRIHGARAAQINEQITERNAVKDARVKEISTTSHDGFVNQFTALFAVAFSNPFAFILIIFVFAGFFYLEGFVVFGKSKNEEDSYQIAIKLEEEMFKVEKQHASQLGITEKTAQYMHLLNGFNARRTDAIINAEKEKIQQFVALHQNQKTNLEEMRSHLQFLDNFFTDVPLDDEQKTSFKREVIQNYLNKAAIN